MLLLLSTSHLLHQARSDRALNDDRLLQEINADAVGANYNVQILEGIGGVTVASQHNDSRIGYVVADAATANSFSPICINISQYTDTSNDPHILTLVGYHESLGPTSDVVVTSSRWNDAALRAITRYELSPNTGVNFIAGSLFSLYRVPRTVIERVELTAGAATITFTDIPQGYEALQLNIHARSAVAAGSDDINVSFNNDVVVANYDEQRLFGAAAVVGASRNVATLRTIYTQGNTAGANEFGGGIITIPNYAKADRHKHYYTISGRVEDSVYITSKRWEDVSPITEIDLTLVSAANFMAGTIVELVGVFPQDVMSIEVDGDLYGIADYT